MADGLLPPHTRKRSFASFSGSMVLLNGCAGACLPEQGGGEIEQGEGIADDVDHAEHVAVVAAAVGEDTVDSRPTLTRTDLWSAADNFSGSKAPLHCTRFVQCSDATALNDNTAAQECASMGASIACA